MDTFVSERETLVCGRECERVIRFGDSSFFVERVHRSVAKTGMIIPGIQTIHTNLHLIDPNRTQWDSSLRQV